MSKVLSTRVADEVYDALVEKATAAGQKVGEYVVRLIEADIHGRTVVTLLATPAPGAVSPSYGHDMVTDTFFTKAALAGPPRTCPRCTRTSTTYSYLYTDGGTWSCSDCRARGRWYDTAPLEVLDTGLPRHRWPPDISAHTA